MIFYICKESAIDAAMVLFVLRGSDVYRRINITSSVANMYEIC